MGTHQTYSVPNSGQVVFTPLMAALLFRDLLSSGLSPHLYCLHTFQSCSNAKALPTFLLVQVCICVCAIFRSLWPPPAKPSHPPQLAKLFPNGPVFLLMLWLQKCVGFEWSAPKSICFIVLAIFSEYFCPSGCFRNAYYTLSYIPRDNKEIDVLNEHSIE